MIWDMVKKPIFSKILEKKNIKEIATRVLGQDYTVAFSTYEKHLRLMRN